MQMDALKRHVDNFSGMKWGYYNIALWSKGGINLPREDIKAVHSVLKHCKDTRGGKEHNIMCRVIDRVQGGSTIFIVFKDLPCTVTLSDLEFHTNIDPAVKKVSNGKGRDSRFTLFVVLCLKDMFKTLRGMNNCDLLSLMDAVIEINGYGELVGEYDMDSTTQVEYCCKFDSILPAAPNVLFTCTGSTTHRRIWTAFFSGKSLPNHAIVWIMLARLQRQLLSARRRHRQRSARKPFVISTES